METLRWRRSLDSLRRSSRRRTDSMSKEVHRSTEIRKSVLPQRWNDWNAVQLERGRTHEHSSSHTPTCHSLSVQHCFPTSSFVFCLELHGWYKGTGMDGRVIVTVFAFCKSKSKVEDNMVLWEAGTKGQGHWGWGIMTVMKKHLCFRH